MPETYVADYYDQNSALMNAGIRLADLIVNKNYLIHLDDCPVVPFDAASVRFSDIRLFHLSKIIYDPKENTNAKLVSVYNSLGNFGSTALMVIRSGKQGIEYYMGTLCQSDAETAGVILKKSLHGNFPGVKCELLTTSEVQALMHDAVTASESRSAFSATPMTDRHVASVSIVPSAREDKTENEDFVQGIEKFIDAMMGEDYVAVMIGNPIPKYNLEQRKRGLESLYSTLAPFESISMTYGQNASTSVTDSVCSNFSSSINQSISDSIGRSTSHTAGTTETSGSNSGTSWQGFFGGSSNSGSSYSSSRSDSWTEGSSTTNSRTEGTGTTRGRSESTSTGLTEGESRSFTLTRKSKTVSDLLEQIQTQLTRIRQCESFGLWESAAYFVTKDVQTAIVCANTFKSILTGENSGVENSFVNFWNYSSQYGTKDVLRYLEFCRHPQFTVNPMAQDSYSPYLEQQVSAASMVSGFELPLMMGLPKKSVTGVTAINMAEFGRNVFTSGAKKDAKTLLLGSVYHMGEATETAVALDLKTLASHCFICGSTGSGKSNTSYQLLSELHRNGVKFMVIEPAKGEYRRALGALEGLRVFTTNPQYYQMLRLNPFSFPAKVHVLEHLDRLIEIFTACWPLYAAMPAILKSGFEAAYIRCGWDLTNSVYLSNGRDKFPTFRDLLKTLPEIIDSSSYSSDSKGDYTGALVTRVSSLTQGISGQIFCDRNVVSDHELFDGNTIVDLSRVGGQETKALIMGILVLKLSEYRASAAAGENVPLRHVTVLEEAHNLLKRGGGVGGAEGANMQGKSIEMISNTIAEIRTFGEGFVIIDQSPGAVDISAIKNTNTKIVMRLPETEDCQAVGRAIGLDETQIRELSRLPTGVAATYQNNWLEPVLVKVRRWSDNLRADDVFIPYKTIRRVRGQLAGQLVRQFYAGRLDHDALIAIVRDSELPPCKYADFIPALNDLASDIASAGLSSARFGKALRELLKCDQLLDIIGMKRPDKRARATAKETCSENIRCLDAAFSGLESYASFQTSKITLRAFLMVLNSWHDEFWREDPRVMELWYAKNLLIRQYLQSEEK